MYQKINPADIAPPASAYNHGLKVSGAASVIYLSGQLGEDPDGKCADGIGAQARQAWANVRRVLEDGGMNFGNIVKVTSYIVGEENIKEYVAVHKELHADHLPPWTLVVVSALGNPEYLVEIDVTASA